MRLPGYHRAPEFPKGLTWIGGKPKSMQSLRGKVVLVDFWTSSCMSCLRTIPHMARLATTYRRRGLVVLGVHVPEFAFEHARENVERAVRELGITYPVVLDNAYTMWNLYRNRTRPRRYV